AFGVYRTFVPAPPTLAVPWPGVAAEMIVSGSPSGSLSLDSGLSVTGVFALVVAESSTAAGGWVVLAAWAGGGGKFGQIFTMLLSSVTVPSAKRVPACVT